MVDRSRVPGNAASHRDRSDLADATDEAQRSVGDGGVDCGEDVGLAMTFGEQRDDLGFGECRAHARDLELLLRLERDTAHRAAPMGRASGKDSGCQYG